VIFGIWPGVAAADLVSLQPRDVAACGGGKVQVGEELNMPAPLDGGSPGAFEAIGAGVAAALDERDRHDARSWSA
jgi:hypothetical protein